MEGLNRKPSGASLYTKGIGPSLVAILALTFYLRFLFFGQYIDGDVGNVAYMGWRMAEGEVLIDREGPGKPPLYPMLYAVFVMLFGPSVLGLKLFGTLFALMAVIAIYWVGQQAYGKGAGLFSALLFGVFSSAPMVEGGTVNLETLLHLPSLLSIGFFLKASQSDRARGYLLTGIFGALATLVKQVGGVVFLTFLCCEGSRGVAFKRRAIRLGLLGGGALLPILGVVSFFLYHGYSPEVLYDSMLGSNLRYIQRGYEDSNLIYFFAASMKRIVLENSLLWIGTLFSLGVLFSKKKGGRLEVPDRIFLWWAFWSFLAVCIPGTFYAHYFLLVVAPFSLLTAHGILWAWERTKSLSALSKKISRGILTFVLTISAFLFVRTDYKYFFTYSSTEQTIHQFKGLDGIFDSYQYGLYNFIQHHLASYLKAATEPNETLYVWGIAPQVYFLAQRRAATQYRNNFNLSENVTRTPHKDFAGYKEKVIEEITHSPPAYILKIFELEHFPELKSMVEKRYEIDPKVDEIFIPPHKIRLYRKKDGQFYTGGEGAL
ncbi:MAG: glycosyltransferase family 39 protein [Desulfobacterota bacterium]|nr:glycosyltransferase family 39 protein [Thermodesulfobacteriota bacterium]